MMERDQIVCKNCGTQFRGKYCNSCGQSADTSRITWKELFHSLPHALLHADSGFLFTLKYLFISPGHFIREYLEGKRKKHFNPVTMLLLVAGLCSVLYAYFDLETILESVSLHKLEDQNEMVAHKFFAIRTVYFCLLCSAGDYLFFRNKNYNYPEIMVFNIFAFTAVSIIQIIYIPLLILGKDLEAGTFLRILFMTIIFIYYFIARYQFFEAAGNNKLIIKIALSLLLYFAINVFIGLELVKPFFEH